MPRSLASMFLPLILLLGLVVPVNGVAPARILPVAPNRAVPSTFTSSGSAPRSISPSSTIEPLTVGGGSNDYIAYSYSATGTAPKIGVAYGSFDSISGLTGEADDKKGADYYSLQMNSDPFSTTTDYTGNIAARGWEQFIYSNLGSGSGRVFIQYWLRNYISAATPSCPTTSIPGGGSWIQHGNDCYANSKIASTPPVPATSLATLSLKASANSGGSGNDVVTVCSSAWVEKEGWNCVSVSEPDGVLNLFQHWSYAEFNVFGQCCGSRAKFNRGTSITIRNSIADQSGNWIKPALFVGTTTLETNNLDLSADFSSSSAGLVFSEGNLPQVAMTVSYSTPGGAGSSQLQPPTFNYVEEGASWTYKLTTTPHVISVDKGTTWSVTPHPLGCKSPCDFNTYVERWESPPSALLTGPSATETLNFVFFHQYLLPL